MLAVALLRVIGFFIVVVAVDESGRLPLVLVLITAENRLLVGDDIVAVPAGVLLVFAANLVVAADC